MQNRITKDEFSTSASLVQNGLLGDVYRDVLRLFQGTDPLREAMQQPFFQDEFVIATDAHKLVCFKKELLKNIDLLAFPKYSFRP